MAYNENLPADTTAPAEIRENFRALKNDKIVAAASAVTATKLETARLISISGDASGSAAFDGTEDITINLDVVGGNADTIGGLDVNDIIAKAMPIGGIIMWSGSVATVPEKWHLCDGTNGTPDLRNRFIVGAGNDTGNHTPNGVGGVGAGFYKPGNSGGEEMHQLLINEMPTHQHDFSATNLSVAGSQITTENIVSSNRGIGLAVPYYDDGNIQFSGFYRVPLNVSSIASAGGNQSHNNMPPYYALAYIMKIA